MKKSHLLILLFPLQILHAQGVGINANNQPPDPSAILDVADQTKGMLIPRMTEQQRNAIPNPAYGLLILNTTTGCLNMWDGSFWMQSCFQCAYTPQITGNTSPCEGSTLQLSATSIPGASYVWTGPNNFSASGTSISIPNVQASHAGTYYVQVTQSGCVSSPTPVSVAVLPGPGSLQATSNSPVLVGSNLQLNVTSVPGATYAWSGPGGFTSSAQNPLISNAQISHSGYYKVTVTNGLCSFVDSVSVTVTQQLYQIFTSNGTFTVPAGVTQVRVLCVGGGGGGASGHQGGGGSGYVQTGTFNVSAGQTINVTVGTGGTGASAVNNDNTIIGISPGTASSFGNLLTANGGQVVTSVNGGGQHGGSGGGGSCNGGSPGGNGGTAGSNGGACNQPYGNGQGNYTASLSMFIRNSITAGAGGAGGQSSHSGGGGGGGILINGTGPSGGDGPQSFSAKGGAGYGGGGGAGGYNSSTSSFRYAGGNGANGVVYVEW